MLTSKERAKLKALASTKEAVFQIGKGDISENLAAGIAQALEKRELVKISVLKGCDTPCDELLQRLARMLHAEPVSVVGNKLILYKKSASEGAEHIEL